MAHYLIRAKANDEKLPELRERLDSGEIKGMRPFGTALDHSLNQARLDPQGWSVWEEEDYCRPPLAMERQAILDHYFTNLSVERVEAGDGWQEIDHLRSLWER